jgi:porphobilinogen synthase
MVAETRLHPRDLVLPVFVKEGATGPVPIGSMPGVVQHSCGPPPGRPPTSGSAGSWCSASR